MDKNSFDSFDIDKTLFVSDLDGTLLRPDKSISDECIRTLNELVRKGVNFTVATARSINSASPLISKLNFRLPIITQNGVFIEYLEPNKKICMNSFSSEESDKLTNVFNKLDCFPLVFTLDDGHERLKWQVGKETRQIKTFLEERKGQKRLMPCHDHNAEFTGEMFYFCYIGGYHDTKLVYDSIKSFEFCNALFQKEIYRDEYLCEIMPLKATKQDAILELKRQFGFEKLISFGDNLNDISMFEISDVSYAVDNGEIITKEKADFVIGSNREDSVVKKILEIYNIKNINSGII